ncbi:MAG: hypothetical protein IPO93_14455 [Actinobacteria bacterium]|nr:hypothetical protein [Actinomycetota bacterium]
MCAATAEALREEGLRGVVVDATSGAGTHPLAAAWSSASLGRLGAEAGADPLPATHWASLASIQQLSALLHVRDALDAGSDTVIVDCGPLDRARQLLELPTIVLRVLDAALTPRLAMRRRVPPDGSPTDPATDPPPTLFEEFEGIRGEVASLAAALAHPATTMRLACLPEADSVDRILRATALISMMGVSVDGLVANRCGRKADGWAKELLAQQDAQVARLEGAHSGALVWRSTTRVRAVPKGRSVVGPLGGTAVLDEQTAHLTAQDEEYVLDLPLVGAAATEAQVGRLDDALVVAFDGVHRWLTLPPVLRRCRATSAVRTEAGLRVSFVPDMSVWRQDARGSAA